MTGKGKGNPFVNQINQPFLGEVPDAPADIPCFITEQGEQFRKRPEGTVQQKEDFGPHWCHEGLRHNGVPEPYYERIIKNMMDEVFSRQIFQSPPMHPFPGKTPVLLHPSTTELPAAQGLGR
jgi:hypothetical protein